MINNLDESYLIQEQIHMYATKIELLIKNDSLVIDNNYLENFGYLKKIMQLIYLIIYNITSDEKELIILNTDIITDKKDIIKKDHNLTDINIDYLENDENDKDDFDFDFDID